MKTPGAQTLMPNRLQPEMTIACPVCQVPSGQLCIDTDTEPAPQHGSHNMRIVTLNSMMRRRRFEVVVNIDIPDSQIHSGATLWCRRDPHDPNVYLTEPDQTPIPASAATLVGF